MTVAAMAVAIGIPIKVISTATNASGLITAYQIDNAEGVNYANEMIVVGYNITTVHYVGFRSANFNRFVDVEQDLSAKLPERYLVSIHQRLFWIMMSICLVAIRPGLFHLMKMMM